MSKKSDDSEDTKGETSLKGEAEVPASDAANAFGVQSQSNMLTVDHSGTTLQLRSWRIPASDQPSIIIVHDLGEQAAFYSQFATVLTDLGFSVYAFDMRGHGHSGRRLGHAPSFHILVRDLLQVAAWVKHQENGRTPIILGHGVGALVVMEFTKHYGAYCRAAILSAPCLELIHPVSPFARFVIKLLADTLPLIRLPQVLSPRITQLSNSPPNFPQLTASFTQQLLTAIQRAEARFIEYHGTVLILCPAQDPICSYQHLKKSAAVHAEHNLEIMNLPGSDHQVFTREKEDLGEVMQIVAHWLRRVCQSADSKTTEAFGLGDPSDNRRRNPPSPFVSDVEKPGATKA